MLDRGIDPEIVPSLFGLLFKVPVPHWPCKRVEKSFSLPFLLIHASDQIVQTCLQFKSVYLTHLLIAAKAVGGPVTRNYCSVVFASSA